MGKIMYKVMCLDIGTKRIGIALSDYLLMLATGHSCIARTPENKAIDTIQKIAAENNVKKIVVGIVGWFHDADNATSHCICGRWDRTRTS